MGTEQPYLTYINTTWTDTKNDQNSQAIHE